MDRPRILLVRTSALGDVVHCLPVLTELRRRLPTARVGWVVEETWAPLLAGHPDLDDLLVVRLKRWRRRPWAPSTVGEVGRLIARLVEFAPSAVLDLMGNHKGALLAAVTLSDRRIGLARSDRREPSSAVWINEPVAPRGPHAVDRALSVLDGLFARDAAGRPHDEPLPGQPPTTETDARPLAELAAEPKAVDFGGDRLPGGGANAGAHAAARPAARRTPRAADRPLLVHPGAGWGNKRYPAAWWGRAGRLAAERTGRPFGVLSGPGEEALAAEVAAASDGRARVIEAVGLPALTERLRQAALVMAGDTGPLHLAHAVGTPVLCLMGPTDPVRNGPYGRPEAALFHRLPCSFCHRRFDEAKACLLEIPPERVAARAAELLDGRS